MTIQAYSNPAQNEAYNAAISAGKTPTQAKAAAVAVADAQATASAVEYNNNLNSSINEVNTSDVNAPTGILRYPYEALTENTDYLRIIIKERKNTGLIEDAGFFNNTGFGGNTGGASSINGNKVGLAQNTLSKGGVILLPIPSNVTDSNSVSYNGGAMNSIAASAMAGATEFMQGGFENLTKGSAGKILNRTINASGGGTNIKNLLQKKLAINAVNIFGANVSLDQVLARSQGKIFNPNMELLFDGVKLRSFNFSFKLTPRDKNESTQIKYIIRSLKKNMSAKTVEQGNLYLKTPNVFELSYMRGNALHPFLNKFKQAALTDIKVNYTAENVYATYDDSTPISMMLDLSFQEIQPVYEGDYDEGDGTIGVGY